MWCFRSGLTSNLASSSHLSTSSSEQSYADSIATRIVLNQLIQYHTLTLLVSLLSPNCLFIVPLLSPYCISIVSLLSPYCLPTVSLLSPYCPPTVSLLSPYYLLNVSLIFMSGCYSSILLLLDNQALLENRHGRNIKSRLMKTFMYRPRKVVFDKLIGIFSPSPTKKSIS